MRIKCQLTQRYWVRIRFSEESQVSLGGLVSISPKAQTGHTGKADLRTVQNLEPEPLLITLIDTYSV